MNPKTRRLRLCLAIPTFDRLGAQRVAVWLAAGLPRDRIEPVFLVHRAEGPMLRLVPQDVEIVEVDRFCPHVSGAMSILRLQGYRRALKHVRPDISIGVTQYPTLAMSLARQLLGAKWPLIASEHSFVSRNLSDPTAYPTWFRHVYRATFPFVYNQLCARVITLTDAAKRDLIENYGIQSSRMVTIPNPVDIEGVRLEAQKDYSHPFFSGEFKVVLGVGRLVWQKGFHHLVTAFAAVAKERSDVRLLILGEGPERQPLQEEIRRLGVTGLVDMPGATDLVWSAMARASVLTMSSEWEGLPMVLLEAAALKVPVVSFDCPSGPREILESGDAGILVEQGNVVALATAIKNVLSFPDAAAERTERAFESVQKYSISNICEKYAELVESVFREA